MEKEYIQMLNVVPESVFSAGHASLDGRFGSWRLMIPNFGNPYNRTDVEKNNCALLDLVGHLWNYRCHCHHY